MLARPQMRLRGCESGDDDNVVVVHSTHWHYVCVHWKGAHREWVCGWLMVLVW